MLSTVLINDLREASCPMVHNVDSDCAVQNICCFGWLPGICSWGFHSLGLNVFYFYTPFHSFTVFHRTSFVCFFEKCLSRFYWCNNAYKLKKNEDPFSKSYANLHFYNFTSTHREPKKTHPSLIVRNIFLREEE